MHHLEMLLVTPCLFIEYGKYPHSDSIFHEAGGRVEYGIRMGIFPVFNKNKQGATILSYLVEKKQNIYTKYSPSCGTYGVNIKSLFKRVFHSSLLINPQNNGE